MDLCVTGCGEALERHILWSAGVFSRFCARRRHRLVNVVTGTDIQAPSLCSQRGCYRAFHTVSWKVCMRLTWSAIESNVELQDAN